jgi:hypothetical protein
MKGVGDGNSFSNYLLKETSLEKENEESKKVQKKKPSKDVVSDGGQCFRASLSSQNC